ncbi:MAG: glucose-6-phosphate isomerase [Nocardioidaceae bacterium]
MRDPLTVVADGATREDTLSTLVTDNVASRLAVKDATLWGPDAEAEASIRLGWVDLHETSRPLLAEVDALRAELWGVGVTRVVLCGMGGSSLAPEVITSSYGAELVVLDSTNPSVISRALAGDLESTVVVVSSKSGGTVETDSQRRAFVQAFTAAGIDAATRIVVVTDPGSPFEQLAVDEGYRKIFLADPQVGGRYSALTAFGLVPSALAGVDVAELLDEADEVAAALRADDPDNPALLLAAVLAGDPTSDPARDKVAIAEAGSGLTGFAGWAEQLIAESTGKLGLGVLPLAVEGLAAPEVRWPAADVTPVALVAPRADRPTTDDGTPVVTVAGPLGAQLLLWETATAVAGRMLGINPFDQPDVESAKEAARGLLDHRPEPEDAAFTDGAVEVRGSAGLLDGVDTLAGAVEALLARLADDGYLAVMAYLDSERDADLAGVRSTLCRRTERPTTFGWGPRFLHSTGQYHKGGPAQGVFLQVTSTEPVDVEIPDRPFTFGTLIAAQAAGDARVLADRGRPVLRLHLTDPDAGVRQLLETLR